VPSHLSYRVRAGLISSLLVLTAGLLTGCGSSTPVAVKTTQPSATITGPGSDPSANLSVANQFLAALAANSAASLASARALVDPGSGAARYLKQAERRLATVPGVGPMKLTKLAEGRARLCTVDGTCATIDQLVLLAGKVSTFTVDGRQLR
jgi:hypothetical protein